MSQNAVLVTGALGGIGRAANYTATFDTNVSGTLLSQKHELRVMQPQGAGSIINLSSTYGHRGGPNAALEAAAYNVRVNAVAPGPIDTEMLKRFTGSEERRTQFAAGVPLKRLGHGDDIADVIVFVASDNARYITGQIIDVNGGKTAL